MSLSVHIHSIILWLLQDIAGNIRALPLDFFGVLDNKALRAPTRGRLVVEADYDLASFSEVAVQVLKSSVRCFWVEDVDDRDKTGI